MIMVERFKLASLTLLVASGAYFAPAALADQWNKETVLKFDQPVQVPGRVLEPGTYVFKLLDNDSQRTIVEIYTADRMQLLTMVMAVPAYRLDPPDKTIITFSERPGGAPEALHHWFYPGDTSG